MRILNFVLVLAILVCASEAKAENRRTSKNGNWVMIERVDPLTDVDSSVVINVTGERNKSLVLRCSGEKPEAYINFDEYIGSVTRNAQPVMFRFLGDRESKAQEAIWALSTEKSSLFVNPEYVITFWERVIQSDRFVAQTHDYAKTPVRVDLDLTGDDGFVSKLTCFQRKTESGEGS